MRLVKTGLRRFTGASFVASLNSHSMWRSREGSLLPLS